MRFSKQRLFNNNCLKNIEYLVNAADKVLNYIRLLRTAHNTEPLAVPSRDETEV